MPRTFSAYIQRSRYLVFIRREQLNSGGARTCQFLLLLLYFSFVDFSTSRRLTHLDIMSLILCPAPFQRPKKKGMCNLTRPVAMLEAQVCVGACTLELRVSVLIVLLFSYPQTKSLDVRMTSLCRTS